MNYPSSGPASEIKLSDDRCRINIGRGVRQCDTVSLKLFTVVLEAIFNDLNWNEGISIDSEHLTHLLFVDDCTVLTQNIQKLQGKVKLLYEFVKVGWEINFLKRSARATNSSTRVTSELAVKSSRKLIIYLPRAPNKFYG